MRIPLVLTHPRGSLSMERALKQIKTLLETSLDHAKQAHDIDMLNASIDDVESMLEMLDRDMPL